MSYTTRLVLFFSNIVKNLNLPLYSRHNMAVKNLSAIIKSRMKNILCKRQITCINQLLIKPRKTGNTAKEKQETEYSGWYKNQEENVFTLFN